MKTLKRKTRPEAFEQKLSAQQLSQLRSWCNSLGYVQAAEMATKEFGLAISKSAVARWFHRDDQELILGTIASGAAMNREITSAYEKNPAPDMATLVSLIKTLVMTLSVRGAADPSMLELANQLFKSSLDYLKEQGRSEDRKLEREKYELLKKKAEQADAARDVIESTLSPEEQRRRLREILK